MGNLQRLLADAVAVDAALGACLDLTWGHDRRVAVIADCGDGLLRLGHLRRTGLRAADVVWRTHVRIPANASLIGGPS